MTWRGRQQALPIRSVDDFRDYLRSLNFHTGWRPSGMALHNTASPTLDQWWFGGTPPEQRMINLRHYYEVEMGWSAGPHAFVDGKDAWIFTDFNVSGVHSPSWNGTRLGIEMVGNYVSGGDDDETGMGKKVMDMTVVLFGECCAFFGWDPNGQVIKLHKEDPATDHDCPGSRIVKSEFLEDVNRYMGDGGDESPPPEGGGEPPAERAGTVCNLTASDPNLNLRAAPSSSSPIVGTAVNDDVVTIIGEAWNGSTKYYRLKFGEAAGPGVEINAWASAAYIRAEEPPPDAGGTPDEGWYDNITATVFGGPGDEQEGAYGGWIDGNTRGVSFPYKWRAENGETRPTVEVKGPSGSVVTGVVDVGPWNTNDPRYLKDGARPLAEKQYQYGLTAQNGQVPTNDAGIDLTEPIAREVGISGKGKIAWRYTKG